MEDFFVKESDLSAIEPDAIIKVLELNSRASVPSHFTRVHAFHLQKQTLSEWKQLHGSNYLTFNFAKVLAIFVQFQQLI